MTQMQVIRVNHWHIVITYTCLHSSNVITVGHGRSEGERVMINTFDTFIDDVFTHLDEVKKEYLDIPVYVFGHSMVGE